MKKSAWIAIGLFAATAAWIGSGYVVDGGATKEKTENREPQPTLVQVRRSEAETIPQYIFAQGSAQPFRTVDVTSQVGGSVKEIEVEHGDVVEAGDVIGRVKLEARADSRASARARVEALEAELAGIRQLQSEGFATESRVRELEASLEEARAALAEVEETIEDTVIDSPIPGVVSAVYANDGQAVAAGEPLATVIDNSPLRVTLHLAQMDIGRIERGTVALVDFATGDAAKGRVCYIAPAADAQTRTFLVEVRVANDDRSIPARISAELRLDAGEAEAHFVSPAILSLNEQGELGVKSVGDEKRVRFHPAEIIRSDPEGVWITGLPEELDLITIGQGFVRQDEVVRVGKAPGEEGEKPSSNGGERQVYGIANFPTASVQSDELQHLEDLPEPPPTKAICGLRGADAAGREATAQASGATAPSTSGGSVPTSTGGSAFADPAASSTGGTAGGAATTAPTMPAGQAGTQPSTGAPSANPSPPPPAPTPPPTTPGGAASPSGGGAGGSGGASGAGAAGGGASAGSGGAP